jgi:hypothetical protein
LAIYQFSSILQKSYFVVNLSLWFLKFVYIYFFHSKIDQFYIYILYSWISSVFTSFMASSISLSLILSTIPYSGSTAILKLQFLQICYPLLSYKHLYFRGILFIYFTSVFHYFIRIQLSTMNILFNILDLCVPALPCAT